MESLLQLWQILSEAYCNKIIEERVSIEISKLQQKQKLKSGFISHVVGIEEDENLYSSEVYTETKKMIEKIFAEIFKKHISIPQKCNRN